MTNLCDSAKGPEPWLRPRLASLTPPGGSEVFTLAHGSPVSAVALTGDGRAVSASDDGTLKVWDLERGEELYTLSGHEGPVSAVVLTHFCRYVASASGDRTIMTWDLTTFRKIATFTADARITALTWMPSGNGLFAGDALGRVHLLELLGA